MVSTSGGDVQVWLVPKKTLVRIGGYASKPDEWVKRFDDVGQLASLRRGNKAVLVSYKPQEFQTQGDLLTDFLRESLGLNEPATEGTLQQ